MENIFELNYTAQQTKDCSLNVIKRVKNTNLIVLSELRTIYVDLITFPKESKITPLFIKIKPLTEQSCRITLMSEQYWTVLASSGQNSGKILHTMAFFMQQLLECLKTS